MKRKDFHIFIQVVFAATCGCGLLGNEETLEKSSLPSIDTEHFMEQNLTFEKRPFIEMSEENQKKWLSNDASVEKEIAVLKQRVKEKASPRKFLFLFFLVILCALFLKTRFGWVKFKVVNFFYPKIDPKTQAIRTIQKLKRKYNKNFLNPSDYYAHLSDVLRHYLEARYHLPIKHQSTPEFLAELSETKAFNSISRVLLAEFLKGADLVKFGKFQPSAEEFKQAAEAAMEFIEKN